MNKQSKTGNWYDGYARLLDQAADVAPLMNQAGDRWRAPECLTARAVAYYNTRVPRIIRIFDQAAGFYKLSPDKLGVLLEDYKRALFGVFDFTATPQQMAELVALQSANAFILDAYGLYYTVLGTYRDLTRRFATYDRITAPPEQYHGPEDQGDALRVYLNSPELWDGRATTYLVSRGQFNAAPFVAEMGAADVNEYLGIAQTFADFADYLDYCVLARYCFNATDDELKQIKTPLILTDYEHAKTPISLAMDAADNAVNKVRAALSDVLQQDTQNEKDTAAAVEVFQDTAAAVPSRDIPISPTVSNLLAAPIQGSRTRDVKARKNDVLPIQWFIDHLAKNRPANVPGTAEVTPLIVANVIEGVNLLQRVHPAAAPVGDWYIYETTVTELANLSGFGGGQNPGTAEINGVRFALFLLQNTYLKVWDKKGSKFVQILNVPEIGDTGEYRGKLRIHVNKQLRAGRPQLIGMDELQTMRERLKGEAAKRFQFTVIGKTHKTEDALLNDIFGYEEKIAEAQASGAGDDVIKGIRRSIQTHKPRDRKRLAQMFDQARAAGVLTEFESYKNTKGETVYKWKRPRRDPDQEPAPAEQ